MNPADADWEQWSARWRAAERPVHPGALRTRVRAVHARARRAAAMEDAAALAAVAGIAAAVAHAPQPQHVARGAAVAALIAAVAYVRRPPRAPDAAAGQPPVDFLEASLYAHRRAVHALWFVRVLTALVLAFLIPWWVSGYRLHGDLTGPLALFTAWLPLAALAALFGWTVRRGRAARRHISALRALRHELRRDLPTNPEDP